MKKSILAAALAATMLLTGCSSKWEDKFDVTFVGSELLNYTTFEGKYTKTPDPIYIYDITNTTDKALHDVKVVIEIKFLNNEVFSFKQSLGTIQPHETKRYNLHKSKIEDEFKKNGITKSFYQSKEISRIEWD